MLFAGCSALDTQQRRWIFQPETESWRNGMQALQGMEDVWIEFTSKETGEPVKLRGTTTDPWGNTRAGFQGEITINRQDYGVSWNKTLDAGGVAVGDEVHLDIRVEAVMDKPAAPPAEKPAETKKKK